LKPEPSKPRVRIRLRVKFLGLVLGVAWVLRVRVLGFRVTIGHG